MKKVDFEILERQSSQNSSTCGINLLKHREFEQFSFAENQRGFSSEQNWILQKETWMSPDPVAVDQLSPSTW